MKLIDAQWEQRNLGVSCYELVLGYNESIDEVSSILDVISKKEYVCVRISSKRYDLCRLFQDHNYYFIENAITLRHDLKSVPVPPKILRVCRKCTWSEMSDTDIGQLSREIKKGIFHTDRISADPFWGPGKAADRYNYWVKDLIDAGHVPYKVCYAGETVGFFLNKETDQGVYNGVLAGTYADYEGSGMGYCIQYAGLMNVIEKGALRYMGHVSASNPGVIHVLEDMGFKITDMEYVFINHNL